MNKPLLTFATLSILCVAHPGMGIAAPAAGSTEEADRQFLAHLEASDSAPSDVNKTAPSPAPKTASTSHSDKPPQTGSSTPSKKKAAAAKAAHSARHSPPAEVADDPVAVPPTAASPATATAVQTKEQNHDGDRVEDHGWLHRVFSHLLSKHPEDW